MKERRRPSWRTRQPITDGAGWCQGFLDLHRHDAVCILNFNFAHAVEHLGRVAHALFGPGTAATSDWLGVPGRALRYGREDDVLGELARRLTATCLGDERRLLLTQTHAYLATRRAQIRYQEFVAAGYPIGSGCAESANKLVVEARLKGAGMHWARANVNPMLAWRILIANDRWMDAWPGTWGWLCHPPRPILIAAPPPPAPRPQTIVNGKPTAGHPWRRSSPFRAK